MRALFLIVMGTLTVESKSELPLTLHELVLPAIPELALTHASYNATLTVGPETIDGSIGRRKKYFAYCDTWISTGTCTVDQPDLPPDHRELREWYDRKYCKHGYTCGSGDCEGAEAKGHCYSNDGEVLETTRRREFQLIGAYKQGILTETCIKDFMCSLEIHQFHVHLRKENDTVKAWVPYTNGTYFDLDLTKDHILFRLDNSSVLGFYPKDKLETHQIQVNCYVRFNSTPLCQLPQRIPNSKFSQLVSNVVVQVDKDTKEGAVRNFHLKVHREIKEVPDDMQLYLEFLAAHSAQSKHYTSRVKRSIIDVLKNELANNLGRDKDINALATMGQAVLYLADESAYNDLNIVKSVNNLRYVVLQLLKALSYSDPLLLAKVINKEGLSFTTSWLSESLFELHLMPKNEAQNFNSYSNCNPQGTAVFKNGKYVPLEGETCRDLTGQTHVTKLTPFADSPIVTSTLHIPEADQPRAQFIEQQNGVKFNHYIQDHAGPSYVPLTPTPRSRSGEFLKTLKDSGWIVAWVVLLIHAYQLCQKMTCFHLCCLLILLPAGGLYFWWQNAKLSDILGYFGK